MVFHAQTLKDMSGFVTHCRPTDIAVGNTGENCVMLPSNTFMMELDQMCVWVCVCVWMYGATPSFKVLEDIKPWWLQIEMEDYTK